MNMNQFLREIARRTRGASRAAYKHIIGAPDLYLPRHNVGLECRWDVISRYIDGGIKDTEVGFNLVVDEQLNALLNEVWRNTAQATAWYLGLTTGTTTPAPGDTMPSHPGWTEWENYSEGARQAWSPGAASSKSITNATPITFTSTLAAQAVDGGFITDNVTRGQDTGRLSNVKSFAATKTLDASETIDITVTITASSS